jgi:large repetitive protein
MGTLARWFTSVLLLLLAGPLLAQQPYQYHVYIDADLRDTSGCTVTIAGQTFSGADYRLTAEVTGSPPVVSARRLAACAGGSFGAGQDLPAGYPVGRNNGLPLAAGGQADVIELMVARSLLPGSSPLVRVAFSAQNAAGSTDAVFTSTGQPGGPGMVVGTPQLIPTLGFWGGLLLALALGALGLRTLRRNRAIAQVMLVGMFLSLGLAAWAANFMADGEVGDWAGVSPLGLDPPGDPVPNLASADIVGVFGTEERPNLAFRIDVVDAENRPPVAVNDSYTTLEDTVLTVPAPGVLGNDSDPDGNPITAQLVSGPTRGTLTLNADGSFSYTPNSNLNGPDSFTYNAFDGQVASLQPATVTINVTAVNDAPSFTAGPNQTVLEDAGAQTVNPWATAIDDGDPEVTQGLTFEITNNTNAALFSAGPAVSPTGVLTYTPAANANGVATITLRLRDDGGTANGGIDVSPTQTFTITVTAVNDAPSFTASNPPAVFEDSGVASVPNWATFNPGPADESGQTVLGYQVSAISNAALFTTPPAVANNGTLSYTAAPNAAGTSTFTVRVQDSGGTANGGVDLSPPQTFTITVTGVNDAPSFTAGPNQSVNEDAGAQTVNPWATAIDDGDPEVTQVLSFEITGNTNPALFAAGPAVSPTGVLSYTPATNANGVATITLRIVDDGGTANGGVNVSATQSFTITVNALNDAPTFVAGPNPVVPEDAGPQSVSPWATAIDDGDPELTQTLAFQVTGNSNPALFSAAPAVAPDGTLTYTPAADANGVATITLVLVDNGSGVAPNQNTSAPQSFTITVTAVNDAPVNTVPGIQNAGAGLLVFSIANGNAISVFDLDAGAAAIEVGLTVTGGTLSAVVTPGVTIAGQGTATLTLSGPQSLINSALDGLSYTPAGAGTDTLTVTTSDLGNTGAGGPQLDVDAVPILIDEPPTVTLIPANGAVVAAGSHVTFTFSESVAVAAGALTISCTPSGAGYSSPAFATSMGVNVTGGAALTGQAGDSCTVTALSAGVTDLDLIDPPNELDGDGSGDSIDGDVDNFVSTYTVDAAPSVTAVVPADGATQVSTAATITVSFSEPVDISSAGAFSLECGGLPLGFTVTSPAPLPASASSATLTPFGGLPEGANCSFTVFASQVPDSDTIDPPDTMLGNFTSSFSTDVAPTVSSVTPAAGETVGTDATLSVTFSEAVDLATGAFTLDCGGAVTLNASPMLPATGTSSVTLTPASALPEGASCTFTVLASGVTDSDLGDPPDTMAANFVRTFSTDAAPTVTSTVPASGATGQSPTGNITVNFSEPVNFSTLAGAPNTSFDLVCNATATDFTVATASPASSVVIDPVDAQVAARNCTLTIRAAGISDVDAADPPDNLAGDVNVAIEYGGVAVPDSYAVTPHLTLVIDTGVQGGRVTANDLIGGGAITGFGPTLGAANSTVPNGVNAITAGGVGGRVILAANGGFTYLPDAGDNAASGTATFFYTVTGGDTAQVTLNFENEEFLWFVDGSAASPVCTGGNVGTQACPATALSTVASADTANDLIFIDSGSYTCGLVLEAGTTVIGNGSSGTLTALAASRVTPVAGSSFAPYDALNGTDPQLTSSAADCITLASGNTIRGLTIGNTGNFAGLVGTNYGSLTVTETTINGSGQILNLDTGTLNASFDALASTSSDNSFAALRVANSTVNLTAVAGTSISGVAGSTLAIDLISNNGSGFAFGGTTVNKSTAGTAVRLGNGSVQSAPVNFGTLDITSGNGTALELNRQTGTVTATAGTIAATNGSAITSTTASGTTPFALTLTSTSSTNSPGAGIDIAQTSGSMVMGGGSISGSAGTAFAAQGTIGTISYAGSISKTSAGTLVSVTGPGTGNLTLSGTLSCTVNCGTGAGSAGLRVSNRVAGTMAFTGASKVFSSSAGNPGVSLDANTGATVTFSGGGLAITTTGGTGFSATNGGAVGVSGNGNTIASTTGAALVIDHASQQSTGLEFASITASGGTSSHGILLDNINGSVTVTGATAIGPKTTAGIELSNSSVAMQLSTASTVTISNRPSTGIRIANTSGLINVGNTTINSAGVGTPAIRIDASSSAITFAQTHIDMGGAGGNENFLVGAGPAADTFTPGDNNGDGDAIYVTGLTGSLTINGGTITRPGDDGIDIRNSRNLSLSGMSFVEAGRSPSAGCVDCNSSGVQAYALTGTNSVANSSFVRGRLRNFYISNPAGVTTLNISGSTFDDTRGQGTPATDNLQIYTSGTASAAFNISNSTFLRSATHQINAVSKDNSAITELDITGITMRNDGGASSGVFVDALGASSIAFNLIGNPQLYTQDENVVTVAATGTAQVQGRIQNNADMRFSTASPGGSTFGGIRALSEGSTSRVVLDVSGNTLLVDNGSLAVGPIVGGDASARIDIRVANNQLTAAGASGAPFEAVSATVNNVVGPATAKVVCLTASGNTVGGPWVRAARARALSPTGVWITGYSSSFAATWAAQGNVSGALPVAESASGGGVVAAPPVPCATPGHALP